MLTCFVLCTLSGNIKKEPGAVVCRMSQSFIRFGTFQLPASRGAEEADMVKMLADFVIRRFYPHLHGEHVVLCYHKCFVNCAWRMIQLLDFC